MFSKQRLDRYIKDQDELMSIASDYVDMVGGGGESVNSVDLEDYGLDIETTYYACGHSETDYYTMPIKYLMVDNWQELELARQEEIKEEKRLAAEAKKKEEKDKAARAEKDLFLTLKKKYE